MSVNAMYWIGPGVISIGGKEYGYDTINGVRRKEPVPLPVSKLDKDVLERRIARGHIGEKIAARKSGDAAMIEAQQGANKDLQEQLDTVTAERDTAQDALKTMTAERDKALKPGGK